MSIIYTKTSNMRFIAKSKAPDRSAGRMLGAVVAMLVDHFWNVIKTLQRSRIWRASTAAIWCSPTRGNALLFLNMISLPCHYGKEIRENISSYPRFHRVYFHMKISPFTPDQYKIFTAHNLSGRKSARSHKPPRKAAFF